MSDIIDAAEEALEDSISKKAVGPKKFLFLTTRGWERIVVACILVTASWLCRTAIQFNNRIGKLENRKEGIARVEDKIDSMGTNLMELQSNMMTFNRSLLVQWGVVQSVDRRLLKGEIQIGTNKAITNLMVDRMLPYIPDEPVVKLRPLEPKPDLVSRVNPMPRPLPIREVPVVELQRMADEATQVQEEEPEKYMNRKMMEQRMAPVKLK